MTENAIDVPLNIDAQDVRFDTFVHANGTAAWFYWINPTNNERWTIVTQCMERAHKKMRLDIYSGRIYRNAVATSEEITRTEYPVVIIGSSQFYGKKVLPLEVHAFMNNEGVNIDELHSFVRRVLFLREDYANSTHELED